MTRVFVLWIGPRDRIATCIEIRLDWLKSYRHRVVREWQGVILGVYKPKLTQK
jgi:hypothetical protein